MKTGCARRAARPPAIAAAEATADAAGPRARTREHRDRRDRARIGPEPPGPRRRRARRLLLARNSGFPARGKGGRGDLGFSGALALKSAPRGGRAELRPAP